MRPREKRAFRDQLVVELTLRIAGQTFALPGGSVQALEAAIHSYGFEAEATFMVSAEQEQDALAPLFVKADLIGVGLSIEPTEATPDGSKRAPMKLSGYVTEKWLLETVGDQLAGEPVVMRRYRIRFKDAAQVFWRQHYPTELHVGVTPKSVLDAHRPEGVSIRYEWPLLEQKREQIALGLGRDDATASYYDFVCAFARDNHGHFEHHAQDGDYRLAVKKSEGKTLGQISISDVAAVEVLLPETSRQRVHVLNAFSEGATNKSNEQPQALTNVRRDVLVRTPIAREADGVLELWKQRKAPREHRVHVTFCQTPRLTFHVHQLLLLDDAMSAQLFTSKKKYRVCEIEVVARRPTDSTTELEDEAAELDITMHAVLEPRADPVPNLPPFVAPSYPFQVEGRVVSDAGGDGDRTWTVIEDEKNALLFQQVDVPLFNKKVKVPYEPGSMPGMFFFPPYKKQRVLLAIGLYESRIVGFLDWADNARLPQTGQGTGFVMGKSKDDGSVLQHVYTDEKPTLTLKRTMGQDMQTLEIKDGTIFLEVREDPKAKKVEPSYDVTPNVSAAKSKLDTEVTGGVSEVTGSFNESTTRVSTVLDSSVEEVDGKLGEVETEIATRVATTRAEVEGMLSSVRQTVDEVVSKVSEAKAAIKRALLE